MGVCVYTGGRVRVHVWACACTRVARLQAQDTLQQPGAFPALAPAVSDQCPSACDDPKAVGLSVFLRGWE